MKKSIYLTLLISLFAFTACKKELITKEPTSDPEGVFEYFWKAFDTDYAIFQERNVNWQAQYDTYRPMVNANTTDDELFEIFKNMLSPLNDAHVKLIRPNDTLFTPNIYYRYRLEDDLFDIELIKSKYLNNVEKNGYDFNTYGWLENNIGYVHTVWTSDNWEDMDKVLDYFESASGLIFDLRHNGGGNFTAALHWFGRFTQEERLVFSSQSKLGAGENNFTDWYDWKVTPEGDYFDKPIVVLTDRYTVSAGERIALAFQTLPNVQIVGDSTNGAFSSTIPRELPNGWNYFYSVEKVKDASGAFPEGIGVLPDHLIENTSSEMQAGQDKALEYALGLF
ncbi:MAG: S41 family peptidase [Crocinitomicaceae bacterium]|nr:S41 family peptidase [Crocinitomicaceae bacterium]